MSGYEYAKQGYDLLDCPYHVGTVQCADWINGWKDYRTFNR